MKLSNFTEGRNNNFNLIRMAAALAVLIHHSFSLVSGREHAVPFLYGGEKGRFIGLIAVDIFFITSGFLVAASLLTRRNFIEFVWARVLRIYPALLVMLLLTVFGLGVLLTSWPLSDYFSHPVTRIYLLKCATLITGISFYLPGVFENNPLKHMVNGSLWTLPYEVRMYAILACVWAALGITARYRLRLFKLAIVISAAAAGITVIAGHFYFPAENLQFTWFFYLFFSGAALFVLKEKITLSHPLFWMFWIFLLSSAFLDRHAYLIVYMLTVPYILLYVAYIPAGLIRKYNHAGDYSYGMYIYAFPVQQSAAALIPGISVPAMLVVSATVTLLLAALSWHFVERRALGLKKVLTGHNRRMLASGLTRLRAFWLYKETRN